MQRRAFGSLREMEYNQEYDEETKTLKVTLELKIKRGNKAIEEEIEKHKKGEIINIKRIVNNA